MVSLRNGESAEWGGVCAAQQSFLEQTNASGTNQTNTIGANTTKVCGEDCMSDGSLFWCMARARARGSPVDCREVDCVCACGER